MNRTRLLLAAALVSLSGSSVAAENPGVGAFQASFSVAWSGLGLGEATLSLTELPEKGCYRYEEKTNPAAFVRWVYGSPTETSQFCVKDGVLRPSHFEYRNDKRSKDSFTLDFDWATRKVKGLKKGVASERDLPEVAYDRLLLQQAVRQWAQAHAGDKEPQPADFVMVDAGRIVTYKFAIMGYETVDTPAGSIKALRVQRIDSEKRSLRCWLAPDRGYAPVKIEQIEDGDVKLRMLAK